MLALIATVVALFAVSCKEAPAPKILKKIEGTREIGSKLVIRHISQEGAVLLGTMTMSPRDCAFCSNSLKKPIYWLEGMGEVNDPVMLIAHYEDQVLEGGQVRQVVTKWGVRSKNKKKFESHFSQISKGEEKHP